MRRIKGMKKALLAVSMTLALTMGVGLTGPAMVVPVYADENNQQNNNQQNNNQQNNNQQEDVASLGKDGYISELQDYANNKIISNGLSKEQATAISNVMNSAINAIKNSGDAGQWSIITQSAKAEMDALVYKIPSDASGFLQLTDMYGTQTAKYGQTVNIPLSFVNFAPVVITDVMVTPVVSNLSTEWPFVPTSATSAQSIASFPAYDRNVDIHAVRQDIGFNFTVREDAKSGYYPLKFNVTYTRKGVNEKTEVVTYIKIVGKPESGSLEEVKDANTSKPRIIVTGFETEPARVKAGETFTLNVHVQNTSSTEGVKNVLFDLQAAQEGTDKTNTYSAFLPTSGSSSVYVESIAPKATTDLKIEMSAKADLAEKPYVLEVQMKYDCQNSIDLTDTASVSIPIYQNARCETSNVEISPESINVGEEANIMFSVYNTGRTNLNNVWVKFKGDSITGGEAYLGNITPGGTGSLDTNVTGAAATTDDGKIIAEISFENESGDITTIEKEMYLTVNEAMVDDFGDGDMGFDDGGMGIEEEQPKKAPIIPIIIGVVVVVAAVVGFIFWKKKKGSKKKAAVDDLADLEDLFTDDDKEQK